MSLGILTPGNSAYKTIGSNAMEGTVPFWKVPVSVKDSADPVRQNEGKKQLIITTIFSPTKILTSLYDLSFCQVTLFIAVCCGLAMISSSMADPGKYTLPRPAPADAKVEKQAYATKMDYDYKGSMEIGKAKDQYKTEAKSEYQPPAQPQHTPESKTEIKTEYSDEKKSKYNDGQKMYAKMEDKPYGKKQMHKRSIDEEKEEAMDKSSKDPLMDEVRSEKKIDAATKRQIKIVQQVLMNRILNDPALRYTLITYPVYRREVIKTRNLAEVRKDVDDTDDVMDPYVAVAAAGGAAAAVKRVPAPGPNDTIDGVVKGPGPVRPPPLLPRYPPRFPPRCYRICY